MSSSTRILALGSVASLSLALAACGSGRSVETQPADVSAVTVEVTNSGEGQKASVRWKDDGAAQNAAAVITQGFSQKSESGAGDQTFPDTRLELPLSVSVAGSGDSRAVTAEMGVPHGSNAELNQDIATAEGFVAEWTAKPTGEVTELQLGSPEKATDTARAGVETAVRQLHSVPILFPAEDIATGATWTAQSKVEGQTEMTQKVTYKLLGRSGDIVDLKVEVEQVPAVTELDTGATTPLKVIESDTRMLKDTVKIDLTKPLPVSGGIDYVTSVTYGDGTSNVRIVQKTHRGIEYRTDAR
nr:hypothetical protein [Corynebacterium lactis]